MSHLIPNDVSGKDQKRLQNSLKLWGKLSDIPINEKEEVERAFLHFPTGTPRQDIWIWFEEGRDTSVAWLMGDKVHPITGRRLGVSEDYYGDEYVIPLDDKEIRTPPCPDECIYVRVCDPNGNEAKRAGRCA